MLNLSEIVFIGKMRDDKCCDNEIYNKQAYYLNNTYHCMNHTYSSH